MEASASHGHDGTGRFRDLRVRIVSSAVVAPIALLALSYSVLTSALLASIASAAMMWEWRSIVSTRRPVGTIGRVFVDWALVGVAALLPLVAALLSPEIAILGLFIVIGAGASILRAHTGVGAWSALGLLFISFSSIGFVFLRGVETYGLLSIILVASVVIASDVGGYFWGRIIGGPKLWPRVSPGKTWAGLFGGLVFAAVVGGLFSWATTGTYYYQVCTVSAIAALFAQSGDLAESAFKRYFNTKDASTLLPGHGGVLDRLDSHMAALLVAATVTAVRGQPIFTW